MAARRSARTLTGAGLLMLALVASCGEAVDKASPTGPVDPSQAEAVLRSYLDDDRCDLLSDRLAETISPSADDGRRLCAAGQLPVDALVRPGQYTIASKEIIDGEGLFTVKLDDGGERDYVLTPGGDAGFRVDEVTTRTTAEFGEPLRLQARATPTSDPVDARVTVEGIERVPRSKLSVDEYVTSLDKYYRVRIRVRSRSEEPIVVGSLSFYLAQENGVRVAEPRPAYSDIGEALPSTVPPNATVAGYLFFAVPNAKIATPSQVVFSLGTGETGAKLVWRKPGQEDVPQAGTIDGTAE